MSGVRTVPRTPILIVVPQPAPTRTEGRRNRVREPECHPGGKELPVLSRCSGPVSAACPCPPGGCLFGNFRLSRECPDGVSLAMPSAFLYLKAGKTDYIYGNDIIILHIHTHI